MMLTEGNNLLEEKFVTAILSQIYFFRLCVLTVDLIINWCFD